MITLTRGLFSSVLKKVRADCVCDVGSRDGEDSLFFRHLLPDAVVCAFEANPINYLNMTGRTDLTANRIEIFPYAITSENGRAKFYVPDIGSNPAEKDLLRQQHHIPPSEDMEKILMGMSSLLVYERLRTQKTVEVETRRLDEFILSRYPSVKRIGLWIDVEGAEYGVVKGITGIKERVVALHVETARTSIRIGQKNISELLPLLASMGFVPCGSNMRPMDNVGDVVFLSHSTIEALGWKLTALRWLTQVAVFFQKHTPGLYQALRTVYTKFAM